MKKQSILLVEDEENLQEALKLNLELEGYEVTGAWNGMEALDLIQKEHFDLLILDVMLPELDGISVVESIRLQNNDIPVLILSAKNSSADRVLGLKKGADDYLTKPFNLEELLLRVSKLLQKSRQLAERKPVEQLYKFGKNKIDFAGLQCTNRSGEVITLTKKEMMLIGSHAPFTWGITAGKAVHNSAVLEYIAHMAFITEQVNNDTPGLKEALIKKHYQRKHGPGSYYGQ